MKRDKDLMRQLLFEYEAEEHFLIMMPGGTLSASIEELEKEAHVYMMIDEGLLRQVSEGAFRLTSYGYDYLDAIRSDTIWNKTKEGAGKIGGASVSILFQIATSYIKQEAATKLGINL